jgi:VIT1/CCC1 family predicted Fe2+/Mn2+ transporter
MTRPAAPFGRRLFPLVIGPVDGILTALTLAASRLVHPDQPIDMSLATRIALAAALSGGFVFFVAEYARLRAELVHAERHLNLSSAGQLATSRLGREVLLDAIGGAMVASVTGFAGAMFPLILGALFRGIFWATIAAAIAVLGLFGAVVAMIVHGRPAFWAIGLMLTGILLSIAGVFLHIT